MGKKGAAAGGGRVGYELWWRARSQDEGGEQEYIIELWATVTTLMADRPEGRTTWKRTCRAVCSGVPRKPCLLHIERRASLRRVGINKIWLKQRALITLIMVPLFAIFLLFVSHLLPPAVLIFPYFIIYHFAAFFLHVFHIIFTILPSLGPYLL